MRLVALLLSVIFLSCSAAPAAHGSDKRRRIEYAIEQTVELQTATGRTFCSGVITHNTVLTAAHCAEDLALWVKTHEERFLAEVVYLDEVQDLAVLLPMDGRRLGKGVPFAKHAPRIADTVWAIGHSAGDYTDSITRGVVSYPRREDGPYDGMVWMQHDAGTIGGNSGGPVVNGKGQLIGITSFGVLTPIRCLLGCQGVYQSTHISGAAHWESIVEIYATHKENK